MTSYWTPSSLTEQYPVDLRLDTLLVGDTPVMHSLKQAVMTIAPSDVSVLVTGPTGAGKEVVAEALHLMSNREKLVGVASVAAAVVAHLPPYCWCSYLA